MTITVLTATIPERSSMVANAINSVANQTLKPSNHIVLVDVKKQGNFDSYQKLLNMATTEWVCFLDDDDELYSDHLAKLAKNSEGYDVIYSNPDVNDPLGLIRYNMDFDSEYLKIESIVPITALVRRSLMLEVGGFDRIQSCDWEMWKKLSRAGARFKKINDITWRYNFHEKNYSRKGMTWND
jgi:glycosyltransferase involved in cell wall biosynthesis